MLPQTKLYRPVYPQYFSLKELTDLYFDNFAISHVKFVAREKNNYFGSIENGIFKQRMEGMVLLKAWKELPKLYENCILGDYNLGSNELSGIIMIDNRLSYGNSRKLIARYLISFKNRSTKLLNQFHGTHGRVFWENNYNEKLIENVEELKSALDEISFKQTY